MLTNTIIETVRVQRPVYALTVLNQSVDTDSRTFVQSLMRAGIKIQNQNTTRHVFSAPFEFDDESSAFADTDICLSYFVHISSSRRLLVELFEKEKSVIVDRHVLPGTHADYHIGLGVKNDSLSILRVPRLNPEDLSKYRFVKVSMVG